MNFVFFFFFLSLVFIFRTLDLSIECKCCLLKVLFKEVRDVQNVQAARDLRSSLGCPSSFCPVEPPG